MITAITPTGGRPEAFKRLVGYMNRQTLEHFCWIVVDDCDPATVVPKMRKGIIVEVIRPDWRWVEGSNTQARSISEGLAPLDGKVAIVEDDDFYSPHHLANISAALDQYDLVGERVSRYYNVATNRYRVIPSERHASLCSVGVKGGALNLLYEICANGSRRIDIDLWQTFKGSKQLMDCHNVTGIKGLPGRGGIGVGHRQTFGDPDHEGTVLRQWIGEDADSYQCAA